MSKESKERSGPTNTGFSKLKDPYDLQHKVEQAKAWYAALSPVEKAIHDLEQRRSFVSAEMRMNDDASPNGVTAEQASERIRQIAPEYVVLDEYKRLLSSREADRKEIERLKEACDQLAIDAENARLSERARCAGIVYARATAVQRDAELWAADNKEPELPIVSRELNAAARELRAIARAIEAEDD